MHHGYGRRFRAPHVLALLVVLGAVAGFVSFGFGTVIPGGGPAKSDCYVELGVQGTKTTTSSNLLECTDGDPTCDAEEHVPHRTSASATTDDAFERAASLFRAAGDVARLRLLERLADGEWCVTELAEAAGTGTRITVTLLHEMLKRNSKRGVATLCVSGGMGMALALENVA